MNNEELIAILEDALRYVHGSYECAFPDEQENQDVADSVVQAINRLKAEAEPDFIEQVDANTIDFLRDALDVTSARIAELEAENQRLKDENRWTPVEERLPTSDGNKDVILVNAEGYRWQTVVWFENARFVLQSGEEVEFWSERRPEPYQGDL